MDKWNYITKQIKKFLDEHPDAPFNMIEISSFDNIQYTVVMIKYLQPEEDLEVDGIGLEHN